MMKKEDSLEVEVGQHEEDNKQETPSKLLKIPQENGISSRETEESEFTTSEVDNNCESTSGSELEPVDILTCQQHFKASKADTSLLSCQQASKSLLLSIEDDDFMTELTPFNDLVVTNNLKSCTEYLPYYRTYTNLLETHLDTNTDMEPENMEGEGVQSSGCIFHPQYEDEPRKPDMDFATGYFPYYRSYEEFFGTSDLPGEAYSSIDSEDVEISSTEELESVIDCEIEEVYEDTIIQESSETNENSSKDSDSFKLPRGHLFINSIIESCDSETSSFNEITSLNEPSSSSGYFPYYRTYEKSLLSSESSVKMFTSSEEALVEFGLQMEGTGDPGDYNSTGCSVC